MYQKNSTAFLKIMLSSSITEQSYFIRTDTAVNDLKATLEYKRSEHFRENLNKCDDIFIETATVVFPEIKANTFADLFVQLCKSQGFSIPVVSSNYNSLDCCRAKECRNLFKEPAKVPTTDLVPTLFTSCDKLHPLYFYNILSSSGKK